MGNMCQENHHTVIPGGRKSRKTILSNIGTTSCYLDYLEDSEVETDEVKEFLTLTSMNTPSYDFDAMR